jgi:broad-specificity NMP kinase
LTEAIILIGAPGSGKSSVLEALSSLLERRGEPHGSIESEQLSMGWPLLEASVWTAALADVLARWRAAGRERFLIAATTEDAEQLAAVITAAAASRTLVIALSAPPDVVASRIAAREPDDWPGKERLIAHARALAKSIPSLPGIDHTINTTHRSAPDVAAEILTLTAR